MPDPVLTLGGVRMRFADGTVALADFGLTVSSGEFVSVVGPSGCGKSTLLRLAAGLTDPTDGTVRVATDKLGYVFQDPTLLPWRTVQANVELLAELHGLSKDEGRRRADEAIELVGLSEFTDKHPRALSGGMRMRVSLARALTMQPQLFLFDEPFGSLDEITRERLNDELLQLFLSQRFTALLVTHAVHEAVFVSSRVVVMSDGPGRVIGDVPVPFAYPRSPQLRFAEPFFHLVGQVSACLRGRSGGLTSDAGTLVAGGWLEPSSSPPGRQRQCGPPINPDADRAPPAEATAPGPAPTTSRLVRRQRERWQSFWGPPFAVFLAMIGVWYGVSYLLLDADRRFLLPPPHAVVKVAFLDPASRAELMAALWLSARVAFVGLAVAIVIGVALAVAMSQARWIERSLYPYAVMTQTIPVLAMVPLVGLWFGYSFPSRTLVVVLFAIFPIIANTLFGLRSVQPEHHDLFTLHGASRRARLWKLQFQAALPAIFTGLRIAAGLAVIGAIVGDFFFRQGTPGIGILIDRYQSRLQSEQMVAAIQLSSLLGIVVFWFFGFLAQRVVGSWHESADSPTPNSAPR
jgi:NitT/TauT family transport system permease protein